MRGWEKTADRETHTHTPYKKSSTLKYIIKNISKKILKTLYSITYKRNFTSRGKETGSVRTFLTRGGAVLPSGWQGATTKMFHRKTRMDTGLGGSRGTMQHFKYMKDVWVERGGDACYISGWGAKGRKSTSRIVSLKSWSPNNTPAPESILI